MITQKKNHTFLLARIQGKPDMVRANWGPAYPNGIPGHAAFDCDRVFPTPELSKESLTLGIKTRYRLRTGEKGKVITPLSVFRFVVNGRAIHLNFTDVEITLEVRGVIQRFPQAKFHAGEG